MALWQDNQQKEQENNTWNNIMNGLKVASMAGNMDPMALLGYGLGKLGKGYYERGQMNKFNKEADEYLAGADAGQNQASAQPQTAQAPHQVEGEAAKYNWQLPNLLGGSANQIANNMAGSASNVPMANQQLQQAREAQMQATANQASQALAQEQEKKRQLMNIGISLATGGTGGLAGAVANSIAGGNSEAGGLASALANNLAGGNSSAGDVIAGAGKAEGEAGNYDWKIPNLLGKRFFDNATTGNQNGEVADTVKEVVNNEVKRGATLNALGRQLANGIIEAKKAYEYYKQNDNQEGMTHAQQQAEAIRKNAMAAGIDLSQFTGETSLQQALQNLSNDYAVGLNTALNSIGDTSDKYYQQIYDHLKSKGASNTQASQIAGERAGRYQKERIANLAAAFQDYGLNDSGSYNNIGAKILMTMLQEDPATANVLAGQYAAPKDDYKNNQIRAAVAQKSQEQAQLQNLNAQLKAGLLDKQHVHKMQEAAQAGQIQAYLRSIGGGGGSSSSGSSEGNVKLTAAQQKEDNQFNTYLTQLLRYTSQPAEAGRTTATDAENGALEGLNRVLDEMRKSGNFDPDTIDVYQERAYNLANSLQAKYHQPQDNYS